MMKAIKSTFASTKAKMAVLMAALMVAAVGSASANTEPVASDWKETVISNITSLVADVMIVLVAVLGVGLTIFALQFGVRKALKFFKSSTN